MLSGKHKKCVKRLKFYASYSQVITYKVHIIEKGLESKNKL